VLDPFAGSGTTLAVAKKLGRQWLGVEFSRDYVKSIRERVRSTQVGEKLDGPAEPVLSAPKTSAGKRRVRLRNGRPLPQSDKDTERGIIDAYRATCEGNSTDYILCDPDLNAEFVAACRKKGLRGDAFIWNRLLLRFRKAGKLQRVHKSPKRLTFEMMDAYSYASEIAMQLMSLDYAYTLDDILCSPKAAAEFDQIAEKLAPGFSPFKYRWAALAIRKRARQSRSLAKNYFLEWRERKLPRAMPLSRCGTGGYEQPGVYVLTGGSQDLYVGETFNVRTRIEQKLNTDCWRSLNLESLVFVPSKEDRMRQHGLQAVLVARTRPSLNSQLLQTADPSSTKKTPTPAS
jgi:site-specific DNA-methyltransferase (adenine-specific)